MGCCAKTNGESIVTSKGLFEIKHGFDGSIIKYKAKFVAKGFSQNGREDYDDIFTPMACYTTIHSIVSLVASQEWTLHQMGEKTTFLNSML